MPNVFIKSHKTLIKIVLEDILFIEADGDYCTIHTKTSKLTIKSTMFYLESRLPEELFLRIHNSTIVNLKEIKTIENSIIHFNSKEWVTVSRSKLEVLKSKLVII